MKLANSEKQRLKTKYGDWALITGASSGIGLELARQLAGAGFNLVINARQANKLEELAQQLKADTNIEIKIVAADVAETEGIGNIIKATQGLSIGLLVVSAGYGTSGLFIESSLHAERNMLRSEL